jgi:hypothetical protein
MLCQAKICKGPQYPMGTAFTYQGRLIEADEPASGQYDFEFRLYRNSEGGPQEGSTLDVNEVAVIDGYFTVELDFGDDTDIFNGYARWLEFGVRPGDMNDPNVYTMLSPRQEVTPTPYAIYAETASSTVGGIDGGGTANYIPKFTDSDTLGNSVIYESAGNVGIGGYVPPYLLYVAKAFPSSWIAGIHNMGLGSEDKGLVVRADGGDPLLVQAGAIDALNVKQNGNVGIGTTEPSGSLWPDSTTLEIAGNAPSIVLDDQLGMFQEDFEISNGGDKVFMRDATDSINIITVGLTGNTEGNVGIGTTNPLSKLSVGGDGLTNAAVYATGSTFGVRGDGSSYGVLGRCVDDEGLNYGVYAVAGSDGSNDAYGVWSEVYRGGSGTYWSGYFCDSGGGGDYRGLYADYRTGYAIDLAEYILDTLGDTEPGDVLAADPDNNESVVKANEPFDSSVVGIVSTKPHLVMGMELIMDEETGQMYEDVSAAQLTLAGRIPVKVTDENGPIRRGDLLTTSSRPGHAMKWSLLDVNQAEDFEELKSILAENQRRHHAVVGKALEPHESGDGKIIALLSLQ